MPIVRSRHPLHLGLYQTSEAAQPLKNRKTHQAGHYANARKACFYCPRGRSA
jgi:hypothetical protein